MKRPTRARGPAATTAACSTASSPTRKIEAPMGDLCLHSGRCWSYPTALEAASDGSGCSLSRRTGEGQGEGRFVRNLLIFACLLLSLSPRTFAASTPIRFAGQNAELVLSEVSERTLRIELLPLDERERPRPPTPSAVLVPFPSTEKLRARQVSGA